MFLWLQQFGESEETQLEEYDGEFEGTAADFGTLLFLALVFSHVSSPDVLYSPGPANEDIEVAVKDPVITNIAGEATISMPNQEHVVTSIVYDI